MPFQPPQMPAQSYQLRQRAESDPADVVFTAVMVAAIVALAPVARRAALAACESEDDLLR